MNVTAAVGESTITCAEEFITSPDQQVPDAAERVVTALAQAKRRGDREAWLEVVASCQGLVNTVSAVQDDAIVQVARRESIWCEDGTLGEVVHTAGRVALDAADLLAPAIGASHPQAQRRVEQAVRLAANRAPAEVDDHDLPEPTGLGGLHTAMASGHLDSYRASVVSYELELAPPQVADAVVTVLHPHLGTADGPTLRRRTRRLIARICPDLLRQRAQRARANTGLRRWVGEPGIDEWHGTFPSEDAATAWAAIDQYAHQLVTDGTCTHIEQARGKALTDLVTNNASIDVQIILTTPATSADAMTGAPADTIPTIGSNGQVDDAPHDSRDDDLVQAHGARPSEPLLVPRRWLLDHLAEAPPGVSHRRGTTAPGATPPWAPCDPITGARLDPHDDLATHAYRPGEQLTTLVRARDGRCRFPGCTIPARFCDLDHVRPWPIGPTTAANLICLCRRHHRIKQRPGWSAGLHPDGTTTWTDPTGGTRTTEPLDALETLVLHHTPTSDHRGDNAGGTDQTDGADHTEQSLVGQPLGGPTGPHLGGLENPPPRHRAEDPPDHEVADTDAAGTEQPHDPRLHLVHPHDRQPGMVFIHPRDVELWQDTQGSTHSPDTRRAVLDEHAVERSRAVWATHRWCTSSAELRQAFARRHRLQIPDAPPF